MTETVTAYLAQHGAEALGGQLRAAISVRRTEPVETNGTDDPFLAIEQIKGDLREQYALPAVRGIPGSLRHWDALDAEIKQLDVELSNRALTERARLAKEARRRVCRAQRDGYAHAFGVLAHGADWRPSCPQQR